MASTLYWQHQLDQQHLREVQSGRLSMNEEVLYHYCSTATFHSIVSNGSIRLSALSLSNDAMEGKLVAHAVRRLAQRDGLPAQQSELLLRQIAALEAAFVGMGFYLSSEGDLLSQWRGYADDGHGAAIGFSKRHLQDESLKPFQSPDVAFTLHQVLYEEAHHDIAVEGTYMVAKDHLALHPMNTGLLDPASFDDEVRKQRMKENATQLARLSTTILQLFPQLFSLKSSAFKEEQEWRLLSYVAPIIDSNPLKTARPARSRLIPYQEVLLNKDAAPILEVILGPKHDTPNDIVEAFLQHNGFKGVNVIRSKATYR